MHSLETIVRRNAAAAADPANRNCPLGHHGWDVTSKAGHIMVKRHGRTVWYVNASDPQDDSSIVAFHVKFQGPEDIKHRVEAIASQHRRMVICEPRISEFDAALAC